MSFRSSFFKILFLIIKKRINYFIIKNNEKKKIKIKHLRKNKFKTNS
jgi:hypothetical protein